MKQKKSRSVENSERPGDFSKGSSMKLSPRSLVTMFASLSQTTICLFGLFNSKVVVAREGKATSLGPCRVDDDDLSGPLSRYPSHERLALTQRRQKGRCSSHFFRRILETFQHVLQKMSRKTYLHDRHPVLTFGWLLRVRMGFGSSMSLLT